MKTILRGEIWRVRFDPIEGSEIGKTRPALVLQNDLGNRYANTTIVAAVTGRIKDLPTLVEVEPSKLNGLRQDCAINLSHIRTVNQSRLISRVGRLEDDYFPKIQRAILISLGFSVPI
jgi:mRNA interferase MazF